MSSRDPYTFKHSAEIHSTAIKIDLTAFEPTQCATIRSESGLCSSLGVLIFRAYTAYAHVCIRHGLSLHFLLSFACSLPFPIRWANICSALH